MDEDVEDPVRLGKRELGRHAFEEQMPPRISALLENETYSNTLSGVIPNLARLTMHDRDVQIAWLCTGKAIQVSKLPDEGASFCGYRNIQMLCLALGQTDPNLASMQNKFTIPQLQDMIEEAWNNGINSHGLTLTGGIKGTRKYIGTSEAEALLLSLNIPCTGAAFRGKTAWLDLMHSVESYFSAASTTLDSNTGSVYCTMRPPIFLQRPKHSITIVGIQKMKSGKRHLLVFDPAWQPPSAMREPLSDADCSGIYAHWLRGLYRKSERSLKRFSSFETLTVGKSS